MFFCVFVETKEDLLPDAGSAWSGPLVEVFIFDTEKTPGDGANNGVRSNFDSGGRNFPLVILVLEFFLLRVRLPFFR